MPNTYNPTSFTNPDPGQGGNAVVGASNTGHANSTVTGGGGLDQKSCLWTGFQNFPGQRVSVVLKVDWSESGSPGAIGNNRFNCSFSINGGTNWNDLFNHPNVNSVGSGTAQTVLSNSQDLTQVQVRDFLEAADDANLTGALSAIRIEVTPVSQVITMM